MEQTRRSDDQWADSQRLESWAGEIRVNAIRLLALLLFYAHHLVDLFLFHDEQVHTDIYHAQLTMLLAAWASGIVALHVCLMRRYVPPALKYVVTSWDAVLVTVLLLLGPDPQSRPVELYFLLIAAAGLRLSLPLVYTAMLEAMAGYVFFVTYVWYSSDHHEVSRLLRKEQIIFLLALFAAGALAGQAVRQIRRIVEGRVIVVEEPPEK